jgi:hypothetical protein
MSEKPKKLVVNCETGVSEYLDLTDEEIAFAEEHRQNFELEEASRQAAAEANATAKASAEAKLAALGLTPEEIAALR